jgi:hypothetical protein
MEFRMGVIVHARKGMRKIKPESRFISAKIT